MKTCRSPIGLTTRQLQRPRPEEADYGRAAAHAGGATLPVRELRFHAAFTQTGTAASPAVPQPPAPLRGWHVDTPDSGGSAFWRSGASRGACTPSASLPRAGTRPCKAGSRLRFTVAGTGFSRQAGANGLPVFFGKTYNRKHGVLFSFVFLISWMLFEGWKHGNHPVFVFPSYLEGQSNATL